MHQEPDENTLPNDVDFGIDEDQEVEAAIEAPEPKAPEKGKELEAKAADPKAELPASVPYHRFKNVIDERNNARDVALEKDREIAELRAKLQSPSKESVDGSLAEKIRAQNAALLQGDEEEAERIALELEAIREDRATNAAIARLEANAAKTSQEAQQKEASETAADLVNTYPALNSESDQFDQEVWGEVCALADSYTKTMPLAAALKKATMRLIGSPAAAPGANPGTSKAFENAKIAEKMPPSLSGAGRSNANASVAQFSTQAVRKMSDKAFRDMSPEEKDVYLGNA